MIWNTRYLLYLVGWRVELVVLHPHLEILEVVPGGLEPGDVHSRHVNRGLLPDLNKIGLT